MERIVHLIEKLYSDAQQGTTLELLYADVVALQTEMQNAIVIKTNHSSSKVNVTLPTCYIPKPLATTFSSNVLHQNNEPVIETILPEIETTAVEATKNKLILIDETDQEDDLGYNVVANPISSIAEAKETEPVFVPSLSVEDLISNTQNDSQQTFSSYKSEASVLVLEEKLGEGDLRKVISLSEKFMFINELFRGEENEYERSLRTIQNFDNFKDANGWIQRELVTKQGWRKDDEAVETFIELVKSRFAL